MDLETFALAATLVPGIYLLVRMVRGRASDPAHVRRFGAALSREALPPGSAQEVIGTYDGVEIYERVTYLGMTYRFDRVAPLSYRWRVAERELFIEPGLLYRLDESRTLLTHTRFPCGGRETA